MRSIALAPATTLRTPSAKIACASIVAVLVPSPTASPVRSAAWRIIRAPRFSSGSFELDLLGDRDAVVADERAAPLPLDQDALRLGAERHAHGVGERGRAAEDLLRASERKRSCLCGMAAAQTDGSSAAAALGRTPAPAENSAVTGDDEATQPGVHAECQKANAMPRVCPLAWAWSFQICDVCRR